MPTPAPHQILAVFRQAAEPFTPERAQNLADEIAAYGGLERAIEALGHDQAFARLDDALAYRALLVEGDEPRMRRLLRQAQGLDARAEPAWAEAASLRGKAAYRQHQGETELAETFLARARAAERFAAKLEGHAFALRLQAVGLRTEEDLRAILIDIAA